MADDDAVPVYLGDGDEITSPERITARHASTEWLAGYDAGYTRGAADVMDRVRTAMLDFGVAMHLIDPIITHLIDSTHKLGGF